MSGTLNFNGATADSFGLKIGGVNVYDASERTVQTYAVNGRIGAVYPAVDYSQIPNEIREYTAGLYLRAASADTVQKRLASIRDWLLNTGGYAKLSDSYEPGLYRRAFFTGGFSAVRKGAGQNFEIPLRFSCDPRRYIAGNHDFTMTGSAGETTYTTPTTVSGFSIREAAKPLIYISKGDDQMEITFTDVTVVNGSPRNVQIGQLLLSADEADFWFDTETLTAWLDDSNKTPANNLIRDVVGEIRLGPGPTKISFTSSLVALTFTPRWWVR